MLLTAASFFPMSRAEDDGLMLEALWSQACDRYRHAGGDPALWCSAQPDAHRQATVALWNVAWIRHAPWRDLAWRRVQELAAPWPAGILDVAVRAADADTFERLLRRPEVVVDLDQSRALRRAAALDDGARVARLLPRSSTQARAALLQVPQPYPRAGGVVPPGRLRRVYLTALGQAAYAGARQAAALLVPDADVVARREALLMAWQQGHAGVARLLLPGLSQTDVDVVLDETVPAGHVDAAVAETCPVAWLTRLAGQASLWPRCAALASGGAARTGWGRIAA